MFSHYIHRGILAEWHEKAPAESDKGPVFLAPFSQTAAAIAARHALGLVATEAGAIIALAPSCPRWASRRVDTITLRHDRLRRLEVAL
jgi:hypothetical protein